MDSSVNEFCAVVCDCNKFISSVMMESPNFKSVDSLVESTHSRKSSELSPSLLFCAPSLAPVCPPRKLTDFSISTILGRENDETHKETICSASVLCRQSIQTPSPQHSYSDTSPTSCACSDNGSSASDCDSEPDQVSTLSEQPPRIKKKRQRTTFSPLEVWELERAYRRQPYLLTKDEEDLVEKLGITAKSLKYWFQNRRAKSRKEEDKMTSRYQSSSSNLFSRPVRRGVLSERQQFRIQCSPDQWTRAEWTRLSYQALENHLKVLPYSRPIRADNHHSSIKSNQLRGRSSLLVPMFRPEQFKERTVESAGLSHSGGLHRNQAY